MPTNFLQKAKAVKLTFWVFLAIFAFLSLISVSFAEDILINSNLSAPRIAPGEVLPIRVRLSNFGNNLPEDVILIYRIIDSENTVIITKTETAAVHTTASFIKNLPLPRDTKPGLYTAEVILEYPGQTAPAVSSYQFNVENKIIGIFFGDFIKYMVVGILAVSLALLFFWVMRQKNIIVNKGNDYAAIPHEERIYYEMIDEILVNMRLHDGDKIMAVAGNIPGLIMDKNLEKVHKIEGDPAQIIALLISKYENEFGHKPHLSQNKVSS